MAAGTADSLSQTLITESTSWFGHNTAHIKENSYCLDLLPIILYISTPVISNYWYLKVNFLRPENLF